MPWYFQQPRSRRKHASTRRLEDWKTNPLNVGKLLYISSLRYKLVYLSSCETALNKIDKFNDEGLHLAGSFQLAAVRHLIARSWPIDDSVSLDIAKLLYQNPVAPNGLDFI